MKILAIITTAGSVHGIRPEAEQFIEMHRMGIHIDIMTQEGTAYAQLFEEAGMTIVGPFPETKKDKITTKKIHDVLVKDNYDILHVLHRKAIACGLRAVKGLRTKLVVYRGASGMYWHDPSAYENALNPRVDKVICVCNDIRDNLRHQLFFKKEKAITVYKGHRMEWYKDIKATDLSPYGISPDDCVIACTANNRKWKGIPTFLDAIDLLPTDSKIHILLIGNGMDSPYYQKKIKANKNKAKIHVLGYRDDAMAIAKAADLIMQTSYKNEGLSRSTIEGMALGCVPIVTNAGGNAELVIDNECGRVVPIKDAQAMADAIMQLYNAPELRARFIKNAFQRIEDFFTVQKTAEQTITIYNELMVK